MSYLVPQLNGEMHQDSNCGPASIASALRWATWHETAPGPESVRRRMQDHIGGTQMSDHRKGWDAFVYDAFQSGFTLDKMRYHECDPFRELELAIRNKRAATIAVSYALVPEPFKCSDTFTGFHAMFVSKVRERHGEVQFKVWDPLADGRKPSAPRGPFWYPRDVLRDACAGVTGKENRAMFNVVRRGTRIERERPDLEPVHGTNGEKP